MKLFRQVPHLAEPTRAVEATEGQVAAAPNGVEPAAPLHPRVVAALSEIFDPEIPVNIFDLGLIYDVVVDQSGAVAIRMTLTAPACPAAQVLPIEVRNRVAEIPGVTDVKVDLVWDPPWGPDCMSDAAKLQLGMF